MTAGPKEELPGKAQEGVPPPAEAETPTASASPLPEDDGPTRRASFEPIPETASGAQGGGRRNAMPEAVVRPSQPTTQSQTASTPWLPPDWRERLPGLALPLVLFAIPVIAALGLQAWLSRTHAVYDDSLRFPDGGVDEVTAMQWSPAGGSLYFGTRSGSVRSIDDGSETEVFAPGELGASDSPSILSVAQGFALWTQEAGRRPFTLFQDRADLQNAAVPKGFAIADSSGSAPSFEGGLFAAVEANNGSAVVGRAMVAYSGQQVQLPNNAFSADNPFNANQAQPDPRVQQQSQQQLVQGQQIQQQRQLQPTDEQLKSKEGQQQVQQQQAQAQQQEALPVDPTGPSGPARFRLSLFRDLHSSSATEVGEIFGIEDVRAVAALPGTDTVIAGDGEGNVFAIDASQQISGVSPETYMRGIGQHEAAIVEIAVAARPADEGVLFATRAEDRSIKVWRGSVSRASPLIPLGDYPSTDVTTPGSAWAREEVSFPGRGSGASDASLAELLAMSADGRRLLARRASRDLVLFDLPAPGQGGAATEFGDVSYVTPDSPVMLSADGSRLLIAEATNAVVEMFRLSGDQGAQTASQEVASFGSLAGGRFLRFAFDRSGERFIAVATDGTVHVQTVAERDRAITLDRYGNTGIEAAISPDGSLVAVAEADGKITIHSAEDGSALTTIQGPQNLGQLAFDASGKRLRASTTDTLRIHTYSLRNRRSAVYDSGLPADAGREGFLPDGERYFMRNGNAGFRVIDIDAGVEAGTLQAATGATGWVSNLDGSRIATLGGRGNVSLFSERESPTASGPMPVMADNALRLSADGRALLAGGRAGELYLARLDGNAGEAGYRLRRLPLPAPALHYEIAPDGGSVVASEADGTVSLVDLAPGQAAPADPEANAQAPAQSSAEVLDSAPAGTVAIAETVEISGHGAPLTAMALSPDGERLATASLDGRLRVTSIAWARLVHRIPLAELPSGPERTPLEPQPLDESPYAGMSGFGGSSDFGDSQFSGGPFIVVYNAEKSLGRAIEARDRAAAAGFPDGLIFRRQGYFRGAFSFPTAEERDAALPRIRQAFSGAYARSLPTWCPDAARNSDFIDCAAALTGNAPPATAN